MVSVVISTILANLATTGCALLLIRRGPTRRLKTLTLIVGLMSLAQTAGFLHAQGLLAGSASQVAQLHQMLAAALSLLAMGLLGREIYDRGLTDRKLRLAEHDIPVRFPKSAENNDWSITAERQQPKSSAAGLLSLFSAISAETKRATVVSVDKLRAKAESCEQCQAITKGMASAWLELHLYMEMTEADRTKTQVLGAKQRMARMAQTKREHELQSGHELMLLSEPCLPKLSLQPVSERTGPEPLLLAGR